MVKMRGEGKMGWFFRVIANRQFKQLGAYILEHPEEFAPIFKNGGEILDDLIEARADDGKIDEDERREIEAKGKELIRGGFELFLRALRN